jgi:undecaprenyl phosphate N,N'-diacetylbacillosamine 1-phosphate transferase
MNKKIQKMLKQLIDIAIAIIAIIIFSVPFLIIALLIKIDSKGPIFFRQERVGKNGRTFKIWKFRSMILGAEKIGLGYEVEKNDSRITKIGKYLRQWSIDELPELFNVLSGEMSLVGPRPTLKYQVEKYNNFQKQRLLIKPGLTGWAQIHGRNSLSWEKRIEYDAWYIKNWSIWLDAKILLKTINVILSKKGIYGK